jgi:hypothetical protein
MGLSDETKAQVRTFAKGMQREVLRKGDLDYDVASSTESPGRFDLNPIKGSVPTQLASFQVNRLFEDGMPKPQKVVLTSGNFDWQLNHWVESADTLRENFNTEGFDLWKEEVATTVARLFNSSMRYYGHQSSKKIEDRRIIDALDRLIASTQRLGENFGKKELDQWIEGIQNLKQNFTREEFTLWKESTEKLSKSFYKETHFDLLYLNEQIRNLPIPGVGENPLYNDGVLEGEIPIVMERLHNLMISLYRASQETQKNPEQRTETVISFYTLYAVIDHFAKRSDSSGLNHRSHRANGEDLLHFTQKAGLKVRFRISFLGAILIMLAQGI